MVFVNKKKELPKFIHHAMRPLPLFPLEHGLNVLLRHIISKHPSIFDRLGEHAGTEFLINPIDIPIVMVLNTDPLNPKISLFRDHNITDVKNSITGTLYYLLQMIDGQSDGDALFFTRDLLVEGDTEVIVALRNTIDNIEINMIDEAIEVLGPLGIPLQHLKQRISKSETF